MYLLFDIGATSTRIAVSTDKKRFEKPKVYPTPQDYNLGVQEFVSSAIKLTGGKKSFSAVGGIPGELDSKKEKVITSPHMPGWLNKPIKRDLEKALKTKVQFENDAAMVGLGEVYYGSGSKKGVAAYITVSSGVGGKRFINGSLDATGASFEPGKQVIITIDKSEPREYFLEDLISGSSIFKRFGKIPSDINDKNFWDHQAKLLAIGLHNVWVLWRPERIVLGGGIILTTKLQISKVENYFKQLAERKLVLPKIRKAKLGNFGGLWGALVMLNTKK